MKQVHSAFLTLIPKLHPVCTSAFVEDIWLRQLILNVFPYEEGMLNLDWRSLADGLFQTLIALCDTASNTIADALLRFNSRVFISSQLLDKNAFSSEINGIYAEFIRSVESESQRTIEIFRLLNQVDQYFSATISNGAIEVTRDSVNGLVEVWINDAWSSYWTLTMLNVIFLVF